jgi:hypothetical protein
VQTQDSQARASASRLDLLAQLRQGPYGPLPRRNGHFVKPTVL